ncbi:hypothetical protein [Streptomyces sp. NPDC046821]|uniref:hypothetical protein n=1 Tax=Streptomyces sp. NPDC046821 TaxID=3154702 RepID=UPI0033C3E67C
MGHHHKPNRAVMDLGLGRGMPKRPDPDVLDRRTRDDERAVGIRARTEKGPDALYEEVHAEIDRQVDGGEMPTAARRRTRGEGFAPGPH